MLYVFVVIVVHELYPAQRSIEFSKIIREPSTNIKILTLQNPALEQPLNFPITLPKLLVLKQPLTPKQRHMRPLIPKQIRMMIIIDMHIFQLLTRHNLFLH